MSILDEIGKELSHSEDSPSTCGLLEVKPVNEWISQALKRPDPDYFFHNMIVAQENTVIFAVSNVGKSILAVQIASEIALSVPVLYLDLELSDKQFQLRYSENGVVHEFPANFLRAEIRPELMLNVDLEEGILKSIEMAAQKGTKFFIIDNITIACISAEKSEAAGEFMKKIISLKGRYGLTIIAVAHTPKRHGFDPLTQYDLAGSAKLISLFDAGIAIGRSAKNPEQRYIKQVKVRTGQSIYGEDNVMVCELVKDGGWLHFEIVGYESEMDLISIASKPKDPRFDIVATLHLQGYSVRRIAEMTGVPKSTVGRWVREVPVPSVPPVPPMDDEGQAGQVGQWDTCPEGDLSDDENQ